MSNNGNSNGHRRRRHGRPSSSLSSSLMKKRSAPPPTATTARLESMLEAAAAPTKKTRRQQSKRTTSKPFPRKPQDSDSQPSVQPPLQPHFQSLHYLQDVSNNKNNKNAAEAKQQRRSVNVLCTGSLEDAPTLFAPKTKLQPRKSSSSSATRRVSDASAKAKQQVLVSTSSSTLANNNVKHTFVADDCAASATFTTSRDLSVLQSTAEIRDTSTTTKHSPTKATATTTTRTLTAGNANHKKNPFPLTLNIGRAKKWPRKSNTTATHASSMPPPPAVSDAATFVSTIASSSSSSTTVTTSSEKDVLDHHSKTRTAWSPQMPMTAASKNHDRDVDGDVPRPTSSFANNKTLMVTKSPSPTSNTLARGSAAVTGSSLLQVDTHDALDNIDPPPAATLPLAFSSGQVKPLHDDVRSTLGMTTTTTRMESRASAASATIIHNDNVKPNATAAQQRRRRQGNKPANNDNFVRLNMKNSAGACRGARNKKSYKGGKQRQRAREDSDDDDSNKRTSYRSFARKEQRTLQSGVDPLDDFVDGVYHSSTTDKTGKPKATSSANPSTPAPPQCARHQRPCKLLVVKKNTKGNKGRKFYVCSLPRGEQCNHFEWADNTVQAAQQALVRNTSYSGFVARQVAAYTERFQTLTVPELRNEAKRRNLPHAGKRRQLLVRLSIWVRDEVAKTVASSGANSADASQEAAGSIEKKFASTAASTDAEEMPVALDVDSDDSDDASVSSSDDELELYHSNATDTFNDNDDYSSKDEDDDDELPSTNVEEPCKTLASSNSTPATLRKHLEGLFGYENFREGQEWAVQRCLGKKRTLLVAPTGFGKSLCYALPAALMDGVCIVVSPLISLMQDQLRQLPPRIPAATLSGSLTAAAMAATVDDVIRNRLKVLFVSPERLASPSFRRLFQMRWNSETNCRERSFPTVSLLCVDEAHCVSQWGHNFRPSYLRLKSLIEVIQPSSVLAMTATAGPLVVEDICDVLHIPRTVEAQQADSTDEVESSSSLGVKILSYDRDNIDVCCKVMANQGERLSLLATLLTERKNKKDGPDTGFEEGCLASGSVIVYVWRQRDSEVVAENLMASGVDGGVVVYHGGMDSGARARAQSKFMRGKARICVATVAFGMGINKADVAGVIHMYLPSSPENYLQETGRAGRDGQPAKAIALVLRDEVVVKHSLAHSNLLSTSQIEALIQILRDQVGATLDIIANDIGQEIDGATFGASLTVALSIHSTVMATDCKVETVETLLSLLEEVDRKDPLLKVQGTMTDQATITLKRRSLEKLSKVERIAACITKCSTCLDSPDAVKNQEEYDPQTQEQRFLAYSFGSHTFSISACASLLGESAEPRHVFAALRRLQNSGELELNLDASPTGRALHLKVEPNGVRNLTSSKTSVDEMVYGLTKRFSTNVAAAAQKTLDAKHILHRVASVDQSRSPKNGRSASLALFRELVANYFEGQQVKDTISDEEELPRAARASTRRELRIDVSSLLRDMKSFPNFQQCNRVVSLDIQSREVRDYTALALTKFFHAIDTPRSPYAAFASHSLYGKWRDVEFQSLLKEVEAFLDPNDETVGSASGM